MASWCFQTHLAVVTITATGLEMNLHQDTIKEWTITWDKHRWQNKYRRLLWILQNGSCKRRWRLNLATSATNKSSQPWWLNIPNSLSYLTSSALTTALIQRTSTRRISEMIFSRICNSVILNNSSSYHLMIANPSQTALHEESILRKIVAQPSNKKWMTFQVVRVNCNSMIVNLTTLRIQTCCMIRPPNKSNSMMKMTTFNSWTWMSQNRETPMTILKPMKKSKLITMIISRVELVLKTLVPFWFRDSKRSWRCPKKVISLRRIIPILIVNSSIKWVPMMKPMKWISSNANLLTI